MSAPVSAAVLDRKRLEARWLAIGFYLVSGLICLDLLARNIGPWTGGYRGLWDFYVVWEVASIVFTVVVTFVYWHKYISHGDATAYADVLPSDNKKFHVFGLILMSAGSLIVAGLLAVCVAAGRRSPDFSVDVLLVVEAGCLTLGVLCLVAAELIIVKAAPGAKARTDLAIGAKRRLLSTQTDPESTQQVQQELNALLKRRSDYDDIVDDIGKVLAFSDAPIGAAFFVIFLLLCAHWAGWTSAESRLLPPFIAGAVALQLLYSNFVFYIEANGAFPRWTRRVIPALEGLSPMIQGGRGRNNTVPNECPPLTEPKAVAVEKATPEPPHAAEHVHSE